MRVRLRPHHAPRFHTLQPALPQVTTLPLAGFRQARDYTCGFATVLMVLRYFSAGRTSDPPALELYRRLGTGRDGTRQNAILRELRSAGLRVNMRYDVDFTRISREIDRNKLIVGYLHDVEHWLVIYGYGRQPRRLFVADPRPDERCDHLWDDYHQRLSGFGIICSSPGESSSIHQEALGLGDAAGDSITGTPPEGPPPPPVRQLRCEVRSAPGLPPDPAPAQLSLPF